MDQGIPSCLCVQHNYCDGQGPAAKESRVSSCSSCGKLAFGTPGQQTEAMRKHKLQPLLDMIENNKWMSIKIGMENKADARKIRDESNYKLKRCMNEMRMNLESRREKLQTLFINENECYQQEIIENFESQKASRIDEMRAKVNLLRDQREEHQRKVVGQKYDQTFQNQCEQMRTLLSKKTNKELLQDWTQQVLEKQRLECEQQEEERMWATLSEIDVQEKIKREEAFQEIRNDAARRGLDELDKQVEYKRMKQADADKIRAHELAMIEADQAALADEKRKWKEEKDARFIKAKAHVKDMLETRDYYRNRKLKREEIVAKEFLKTAIRELFVEEEDRNKKKRELMRSIQTYCDYLKRRDCLENAKEEAVQRIIDGVIEEQHKKVMESRFKEHEQRRQLFQSVMAGRKLQVDDLRQKQEKEAEEHIKEMQLLKEDWKKYLQDLEVEKQEKVEKTQQYRKDLDCQVAYNNKLQVRDNMEIKREDDMCELEEKLFNFRLQKTLNEAQLTMSNPYRQPLVGKPVKQCFRPV